MRSSDWSSDVCSSDLAAAQIEPGSERELVAVVARQVDRDEVRIARRQPLHRRPARIARAVVDEDDFVIPAHRRARRRADARVERLQTPLLVVARDDDRKSGTMHCRAALAAHDARVIGVRAVHPFGKRAGAATEIALPRDRKSTPLNSRPYGADSKPTHAYN